MMTSFSTMVGLCAQVNATRRSAARSSSSRRANDATSTAARPVLARSSTAWADAAVAALDLSSSISLRKATPESFSPSSLECRAVSSPCNSLHSVLAPRKSVFVSSSWAPRLATSASSFAAYASFWASWCCMRSFSCVASAAICLSEAISPRTVTSDLDRPSNCSSRPRTISPKRATCPPLSLNSLRRSLISSSLARASSSRRLFSWWASSSNFSTRISFSLTLSSRRRTRSRNTSDSRKCSSDVRVIAATSSECLSKDRLWISASCRCFKRLSRTSSFRRSII
mmetsp:Transcript_92/g.250  ORF Transcript_92/g.250 Transcript_92/m.250 type:complete len:284 (+) Transcript_92:1897-2748(+)